MLLIPVREIPSKRKLLGRVRARHAVAEIEARVEPGEEGPLERLHGRDFGEGHAGVGDLHGRLLRLLAGERTSQPVAVERLDDELPAALDAGDLLPLDLEVGVRVVGRERQHVLLDFLDLADEPIARGGDHHVVGRIRGAGGAQDKHERGGKRARPQY